MKRCIVLGLAFFISGTLNAQLNEPISSQSLQSLLPLKYVTAQNFQESVETENLVPNSGDLTRGSVMLSSLILPGWGERRLGETTRGTIFTSAEAVLWLGYIGLTAYADWRERDFQAFAANYGGVNPSGKNGQFWVDIGAFDNVRSFNETRLRDRRDDRVYQDTEGYWWDWPSYEIRVKYDKMRLQSRAASRDATFALGAVVVNHILSALDVTYLYNTHFSGNNGEISYNIQIPLP